MDHVVVGSLHERGVDVAERQVACSGQTGGECDGMLLGDAYVEGPLRYLPHHDVHTAA